ncbi:MAG TPA: flagellar FliJ family protein [Clostridia bacterium]|nr:flagellar FliJ family protein [Clostridia bacterium]
MKKFDYTLENVLKLRIKTEDDRLVDFSRAQQSYFKHLKFLENIDEEISEVQKSGQSDKTNQLAYRKHNYYYLENLRLKKERCKNTVNEAGKICEMKRQAFEKAQIKRKTLETHKEKQIVVHKREQKREEERMLDEMAVTAFKRRREL